MMLIDVHAHIVPRRLLDWLRVRPLPGLGVEALGSQYAVKVGSRTFGPLGPSWVDLDAREGALRALRIRQQVLSPPPFTFGYELTTANAAEFATRLNDEMVAICEGNPAYRPLALLPLGSAPTTLRELDRVLQMGVAGVVVGGNVVGRELDDPVLEPVWEALGAQAVPVLLHPRQMTTELRLAGYHLVNLIGNPLDTAVAWARLYFSRVLERHAGLRIIFAHAGGFVPSSIGRFEHGRRVRGEAAGPAWTPLEAIRQCCYFDSITHSSAGLAALISLVGYDRVMVGTDFPSDMRDDLIADRLENSGLAAEICDAIGHGSAAALFRL